MNQLDLIWELESHNNKLEEYNRDLGLVNEKSTIKTIESRVAQLETEINKIKEELKEKKLENIKKEKLLKNYIYKGEEIDKDLYRGNISDIKQLEYLSQEKNDILRLTNDMELGILSIMEEIEELENLYDKKKEKLGLCKIKLSNSISEYKENIVEIEKQILNEESLVNKIIKNIDGKVLNTYYDLKNRRGKAIVSINNNICSGCNMMVPTYLLNDLKKKSQIIFCENCGRILYYKLDKDV